MTDTYHLFQRILEPEHIGNMAEAGQLSRGRDEGLQFRKVEVTVPEEYMGDVIGDISSRRGKIEGTDIRNGAASVRAQVPLSEMFGYATDLRSKTQGRASYSMFFHNYEQVPKNIQEKVLNDRK